MAISSGGVLGHQNGKVGPVVFYTARGQQLCRALSRGIDKPTDNQKVNRKGMAVTMELLQPLHNFLNCGFELEARGTIRNEFNLAVSYNKKQALTGDYPNIRVNYKKVLLSKGVLPSTDQASIKKAKGGVLLNWNSDTGTGKGAYGSDMVMIALYYPGRKEAGVYLYEAKRKDGEVFISISDKTLSDEPTEAYLFFKSTDGKRISDSVYVGNLNGRALNEEERKEYEKIKKWLQAAQTGLIKEEEVFLVLGKKTKAFRNLQRECGVWQKRLDELLFSPT